MEKKYSGRLGRGPVATSSFRYMNFILQLVLRVRRVLRSGRVPIRSVQFRR